MQSHKSQPANEFQWKKTTLIWWVTLRLTGLDFSWDCTKRSLPYTYSSRLSCSSASAEQNVLDAAPCLPPKNTTFISSRSSSIRTHSTGKIDGQMSELPDGYVCLQNLHITCLFPASPRTWVGTCFFLNTHQKQISICGHHDRECNAVRKHLGRG